MGAKVNVGKRGIKEETLEKWEGKNGSVFGLGRVPVSGLQTE